MALPTPALLRPAALLLALPLVAAAPALAQRQTFTRGTGTDVGPRTNVVPTNCVTAADGAITCGTELQNPPGRPPARVRFDLFEN